MIFFEIEKYLLYLRLIIFLPKSYLNSIAAPVLYDGCCCVYNLIFHKQLITNQDCSFSLVTTRVVDPVVTH